MEKEPFLVNILYKIFPLFRAKKGKIWLSGCILILTNLIPLFGVLFLHWEPWLIIILYWTESGIIGIYNIFKMLISGMFNREKKFSPLGLLGGLFLSLFFLFHYGMFMFCHGFLIITIISGVFGHIDMPSSSAVISQMEALLTLMFEKTSSVDISRFITEFITIAALCISHGISFFIYFVKEKKFFTTWPFDYMVKPYQRIIVMHITGVFGVFLLVLTNWKATGIIVLWVIIKVITDLRVHVKSHMLKQQQDTEDTT